MTAPAELEDASKIANPNARIDLPRKIGFWGATAVLVGSAVGSGIFAAPTGIAKSLGSPTLILALWVAGGIIALCGALTFAELGAMLPRTGGIYVFLREGLGNCPAFVFGWTYMLITKPSAAGGIATVFSTHFKTLTGLDWNPIVMTIATLFILTLINVLGVRGSARFAIALTGLKYAAIGAIIVLGVFAAIRQFIGGDATAAHFVATAPPMPVLSALAPVMAAIMWTYDGWADVGFVAGEVKDPDRTLPRVFVVGTLAVIALYVLANCVYLWHLTLPDMRSTETVAPLMVQRLIGPVGMIGVTTLIILSTFGSTHASLLTGGRVMFAQAQDGLQFRFLGRIHPRFQTPAVALWTQFALSSIVVLLLRNFADLAGSFTFTIWIFYGLSALSVFILRYKNRDAHRPFRVPGYPYIPAIFVLASLAMTVLALINNPTRNGTWLLILAAGVPVYFVWRKLFPASPS